MQNLFFVFSICISVRCRCYFYLFIYQGSFVKVANLRSHTRSNLQYGVGTYSPNTYKDAITFFSFLQINHFFLQLLFHILFVFSARRTCKNSPITLITLENIQHDLSCTGYPRLRLNFVELGWPGGLLYSGNLLAFSRGNTALRPCRLFYILARNFGRVRVQQTIVEQKVFVCLMCVGFSACITLPLIRWRRFGVIR